MEAPVCRRLIDLAAVSTKKSTVSLGSYLAFVFFFWVPTLGSGGGGSGSDDFDGQGGAEATDALVEYRLES